MDIIAYLSLELNKLQSTAIDCEDVLEFCGLLLRVRLGSLEDVGCVLSL